MLGMAYKKDIDDLRESPSLTIIELLRAEGAEVLYNDPYFPTVGRGRHYNLNMTCTPLEKLEQYDCVLIVTDHSDYDYEEIVQDVAAGGGFAQCNQGNCFGQDCALLRAFRRDGFVRVLRRLDKNKKRTAERQPFSVGRLIHYYASFVSELSFRV